MPDPKVNTLSIRSYSRQKKGHSHSFHQLVLPIRGVINIEVGSFTGKVKPGECVVIKAGEIHHFAAQDQARFVVADLATLPKPLEQAKTDVFSVTPPLLHFLSFIEEQLKYQINKSIEQLMFNAFYALLGEQQAVRQLDQRLRNSLQYIETHLSCSISLAQLSDVACLSPTQFKKLFKQQTGLTVTQYITQLRMDKAQALLLHTDYPVQIIAESVGYTDYSAFSRRFSNYFGFPPSKFVR